MNVAEYKKRSRILDSKRAKLDKTFIKANCNVKIGDIIRPETNEKVMVKRISLIQNGGSPKFLFHGIFINKKTGKPFKNGKGCSICNNRIVLTTG